MSCAETIQINTDVLVEVANVRGAVSGSLINGATVTAELLTMADVAVTGSVNPFTLSEVGTTGTYQGTLSKDFALVADTSYKLKIIVDGGSGLYRTEIIIFKALE